MKYSAQRLIILILLISSVFVQNTRAQAVSTLSGQYGCILNRNYAGFSTLSGSVVGSGITGTNFMLYFDFTAKTAQVSVVGVHNWGTSNVQTASLAGPLFVEVRGERIALQLVKPPFVPLKKVT